MMPPSQQPIEPAAALHNSTRRKGTLLRTLFAALGLTTIFQLWVLMPAVAPSHDPFYHWSGAARTFFLPIALNIFLFWFVLALVLLAVQAPGRLRAATWGGLLFFAPWIVLYNATSLLLPALAYRPSLASIHAVGTILFLGALLATVLLAARWRPTFTARFERIISTATTILVFTGIFGAILLCQLTWYAWQGHRTTQPATLHPQPATATIQPHRILWIVLDELSYQQVYEHRFSGLQLPAFDALAKQSTLFTNAIPPAIHTEIVLPGLLTGIPVDRVRPLTTGELSLHNASTGQWQLFHQHDTSFQDARNAGYSTAIAGWYNPYCRLLPDVLDHCYWTYNDGLLENRMAPNGTVLSNTLAPPLAFLNLLSRLVLKFAPTGIRTYALAHLQTLSHTTGSESQLHIDDYQNLYAASQTLLRDRSAGFVLLHLPVPHPGGIYNRATGRLTTSPSTYIDNLALADKCLAGIRQTLEQTGQWDSSTIVIMGDHGWRTPNLEDRCLMVSRGAESKPGRPVRPAPRLHRKAPQPDHPRPHRHPVPCHQHPQPLRPTPRPQNNHPRRTLHLGPNPPHPQLTPPHD